MTGSRTTLVASLLVYGLLGCTREQRPLSVAQPATPPQAGTEDPRVPRYQKNFFQVSQGGRYFVWYGCGNCHVDGAAPALDLTDLHWRHGEAFADVYRFIGHGHAGMPACDDTIPIEQLWQITAYVRSLPVQDARMRRRESIELVGEPRGSAWSGALR